MASWSNPPVASASGAACVSEPPRLSARWESVPVLTGLALGCFANWAGGCEAQHLIIVRLQLDSTVDERKGGDYTRNRDI